MQKTNQEKQSYQINQDFILGKKLEGGIKLSTVTNFSPAGDQPEAIKKLISGVKNKNNEQNAIMIFWHIYRHFQNFYSTNIPEFLQILTESKFENKLKDNLLKFIPLSSCDIGTYV